MLLDLLTQSLITGGEGRLKPEVRTLAFVNVM